MRASWALILVLSVTLASPALARDKKSRRHKQKQETEAPAEPPPEPEPEPLPEPEPEPMPEEAPPDENVAPADEPTEPEEVVPGTAPTWWFGAYVHGVWVPGFMLGLFLDGPPTVGNAAFGAQVTHRSPDDGFSWVLGLGYAGYGFEGPLRKTGDPSVDTEWVKSTLGIVHVSAALLWSTQLHEMLSFEYGIGLDFGFVTGKMMRSEAYKRPGGGYAKCNGAGSPFVPGPELGTQYCEPALRNGVQVPTNTYDEYGAHYNVEEERIPPVALLPALPQLALRFSPHRNVAVKLEGAYGIFQFWFGLSAAYGADL
jgi:hypothetical protein